MYWGRDLQGLVDGMRGVQRVESRYTGNGTGTE